MFNNKDLSRNNLKNELDIEDNEYEYYIYVNIIKTEKKWLMLIFK